MPWGVNYDHDEQGRLLEQYWYSDWPTVDADFNEIKTLGANVVRIHLQTGSFMDTASEPNKTALEQLKRLLKLAEKTGLYLDITGLACYRAPDVPAWYEALDEAARWQTQAVFWEAIAKTCADSNAVFCYDLMNEPVVGGPDNGPSKWLAGEGFGGYYFVQRIAYDLAGRSREDIARAWVDKLVAAIRKHDNDHLITVGVIPWAMVWPNAKPIFYSPQVSRNLDIACVHFYPKAGQIDKALQALKVYDINKPLIIEEMFPLGCSIEELNSFIDRSKGTADGWISFYWGKTPQEYESDANDLASAIKKEWLKYFSKKKSDMDKKITNIEFIKEKQK